MGKFSGFSRDSARKDKRIIINWVFSTSASTKAIRCAELPERTINEMVITVILAVTLGILAFAAYRNKSIATLITPAANMGIWLYFISLRKSHVFGGSADAFFGAV